MAPTEHDGNGEPARTEYLQTTELADQASAETERRRLIEDARRDNNWKRWGPYLSERQWATVREDYSPEGSAWSYFPHDHARSRAYRWGEDGLLGICDRECRLCFALALWNERDPILKERLFGLTNLQGNHGEDVKEAYYYLDSTPTHSYLKAMYRYPQAAFPYEQLIQENARRASHNGEFELIDTGVFEEHRFFDIVAEYAKAGPNDILIRITAVNRGPQAATLHLLPTLWFRNTWTWGCGDESCWPKPAIHIQDGSTLRTDHVTLGPSFLQIGPGPDGRLPPILLTDNETNHERLYNVPNHGPYVKDAFHDYVVTGKRDAIKPKGPATKAAARYVLKLAPGEQVSLRLRLAGEAEFQRHYSDQEFDAIFHARQAEADAFYCKLIPEALSADERNICRQAYAGLLWSKQFYYYVVSEWLDGDPAMPPPPVSRKFGRNHDWRHLFNRDVISMPDKWEYPWYAAWDVAFHMIPFARIDPDFAKSQLILFLREWYLHPNGELPAYEYALGDVNPPVHAWACWRVYKIADPRGRRDHAFLARAFQKLLLNFTWWVNRKDREGNHMFSGGFLGLDNIGIFDRSQPLPGGGWLQESDATAWMAFYCATMLSISLELATVDPVYEDMATTFFEHFVAIADAMNTLGGDGLWDEQDGFYYDKLATDQETIPLRVRSLVGLIPLLAVELLDCERIGRLPGFRKRMEWFMEHRKDLARSITYMDAREGEGGRRYLLAIPNRKRLERVLRYMLDENEFLSPFGIRSLSKYHQDHPFSHELDGRRHEIRYEPGESTSRLFGGNSNWRGPVWFPINFLLIEALERYDHFYGDELKVECPTGSGRYLRLVEVAAEIRRRLVGLFVPQDGQRRPCQGNDPRFVADPLWRGLPLFHEYFHADSGRGLGASHQTGWTALISECLRDKVRDAMRPTREQAEPLTAQR